jgi:pyridoxine 4-dehydrogenase
MSIVSSAGTLLIGGDIPVCRFGYGAMQLVCPPWAFGPPAAGVDPMALLHRVRDLGINFIDTADIYGPHINELQIAEALCPYPPDLLIATKGGLTRPAGHPDQFIPVSTAEHLRAAIEGSMRRLKLDCIDLYQLHQPAPDVPIEAIMETLVRFRAEGKLRHIGLSNVTVEQITRARAVTPIATVQNLFNLVSRTSDAVLTYCEANGIVFIPWYPLAAGDLGAPGNTVGTIAERHEATPSQVALAWLLNKSPSILLIAGTSSIAHLEHNVVACRIKLSPAEMALLDGFAASQEKPHWMEVKLDQQHS